MKGERLATTPISPRQAQVLGLVREIFDGKMPNTVEAYSRVATEVGWKTTSGVRDSLFALRAKGAVRSIGGTITRPERWEVVT